jgi:hypothetical protein
MTLAGGAAAFKRLFQLAECERLILHAGVQRFKVGRQARLEGASISRHRKLVAGSESWSVFVVFDHVTGQKFQRFRVSLPMPDQCIEPERKSNPYDSPDRRFLRARRVRLALEAKQINGQHAEHAGVKGDPEPEIRVHLNLI